MTAKTIAELFDLTGEGAIVTGGAVGIGQAISFRLAEAGASVMISDIDMEAANQTVEQIKDKGGKAQAVYADASSAADARKAVQSTVDAFGRLDILVNNAGVFLLSPSLQTSEEILDKTFNINLKGPFLYSQAAAQEMIKSGRGGKIINMSSAEALRPTRGLAHYDASKGGIVSLTQALALEFGRHNILVNAVAPAGIMTPGVRAMTRAGAAATGRTEEELMSRRLKRTPLGRLGEPDEIAKVTLFLASGAASYMTGSLVLVDGGFLLS